MRPSQERRYQLVPQMRDYDSMAWRWTSHVMFIQEPDFRSEVCNTDKYGFRFTVKDGRVLDYDTFQQEPGPKGLVCGGSTAFGSGATSDGLTIPSFLNRGSEVTWFNFASIAHNSTQELLQYLFFSPRVDQVVLFSGINNLAIHTWSPLFSEVYGSIYGQSSFQLLNYLDSDFQFIKYLASRAPGHLVRRLRRIIPQRFSPSPTPKLPDFETRYGQSLKILERDLDVWAMFRDQREFSLLFVLQPVPQWMGKVLTAEEEELIEMMSSIGSPQLGVGSLQADIVDIYPRYQQDIKDLCDSRGIPWLDCNKLLPKEGWLFCDRTHLTDQGQELAADVIRSACPASV